MPRVPTYDNFQVSPQGLPGARQFQSVPQVVDVAGPALRQNAQLDKALGQGASLMADVALQAQNEANTLRVDEAKEQALRLAQQYTYDPQNGYMSIRGRDAMERESGKPLDVEYTDKLAEDLRNLAKGLGNDAQRRMFTEYTRQALPRFQGQVMQHKAQEYQTYRASVREGTIANRTQDIALNYNNPQAIGDGINSIKAAVWDLGRMQGWAAEKVEAEQRKATSQAHRAALTAALQNNDLGYAAGYLKANMKDMDANDILRIGGLIREGVDLQAGQTAADATFVRFAPQLAPSDLGRAYEILIGAESGGQQFDDTGKPLTSSAGAVGVAQVMPGTGPAAAKLAGLPWDEEKFRADPEYNRALGRAYFGQQVKDFDGNLAQAYAAYNAGPRWVSEAAARASKAKPGTQEADWFWQLNNDKRSPVNRQQTQAYVEKNMKAYAAGLGVNRPTLAEMKADLRQDPRLAGSPERLKAAETRLESRYKDLTAAIGQREEEALDTAYKTLWANKGDMNSIPADVRATIPGDKLSGVLSFAEKVAKGPVNDPAAWAEILSMPPAQLSQMTPADFYRQFRTVLDDTHLEKGYALLKEARGDQGADAKHLEIISTAQRVKQAAMSAGIIPADGGKANEGQLKAFGQFSQAIDDRVRQYERVDLEGKRKVNSEELQQILDTALMDTVNVSVDFWVDTKDQPALMLGADDMKNAYVNVNGQDIKLGSIPPAQRAQIAGALRARGRPVTEKAIAALWVAAGKPKD